MDLEKPPLKSSKSPTFPSLEVFLVNHNFDLKKNREKHPHAVKSHTILGCRKATNIGVIRLKFSFQGAGSMWLV